MKDFSKTWVYSKSPRKQRKYRRNAPLNIKKKMLSVHLSKELRQTYKTRNVIVRKGDLVVVTRGKFKGQDGKVDKVYTKQLRVTVDGIKAVTKKGNKVPFKLRPSALIIKELNLTDTKRTAKIGSYGKTR